MDALKQILVSEPVGHASDVPWGLWWLGDHGYFINQLNRRLSNLFRLKEHSKNILGFIDVLTNLGDRREVVPVLCFDSLDCDATVFHFGQVLDKVQKQT